MYLFWSYNKAALFLKYTASAVCLHDTLAYASVDNKIAVHVNVGGFYPEGDSDVNKLVNKVHFIWGLELTLKGATLGTIGPNPWTESRLHLDPV